MLSIFLMWVFIREPQKAPQDLERTLKKSKTEAPGKSQEPNRSEAVSQTQINKQETSEPAEPKARIIKEEQPKDGETRMDMMVRRSAASLGVPDAALKRRKLDKLIRFSVPINRSQMDLTYANMIFKGNLEREGATLLRGEDNRNQQSLSFYHKDSPAKYQIDLYYDSKYYHQEKPQKRISIVVDDFGAIGGELLDGFFGVDKEVCFAVFPQEANSVSTVQRASRQGRETLIHVPMEPIGYPSVNPGDNAILVQHSEAQIDKMLSEFIEELPGAMGINNHMGSLATTDPDVMQVVMNTLKRYNKHFLDSRTTNVSVAYQTAQKAHLKAYRNDLFLDSPSISQSNMESKLNQILKLSESKKHIIAITHCHNADKLEYLKSFIVRLKKAGFTLVPLSEYGNHEVPEIL